MTSKILSNKLGLKSPMPKCDKDMDKLKKENAALNQKLEDSSKSKMSDAERNRLLEKILDLETQKVKNGQDFEAERNHNNAVNARNKGLVRDANEEARRIEDLSSEIRTRLTDMPPHNPKTSAQQTGQDPSKEAPLGNVHVLEAQLKDALEKNQQWLVYDQQREAYVLGLMARIFDLEKQVTGTKQNLEQAKEKSCDDNEIQKYYDRLLIAAKKELEGERQITGQLNSELSEMRQKLEETKKEAADLLTALKLRSETERQQRDDFRHLKDKMQRLKGEMDVYQEMYEEEKNKNSELSAKIERVQNLLMKQQEDQQKVAILEHQILKCTADLENEKFDRKNVQHQLYKVLKELRKTREQITKLEPGKRDLYYVDATSNFVSEFDDKLSTREKYPSPKPRSVLDESFLECPTCQTMYPTSQHRELLAHIDVCTS